MSGEKAASITADPGRFTMLAIYSVLSATNSAMWNTFAPISDDSETFFDTNATAINWLAIIWSVVYVVGTALGIYYFQKYALRDTLLLCALLTAFGSGLRYIAVLLREQLGALICYSLVFLGQILIGLGQPIVVNLATGMASIWFPLEERDRATTIGTIFNPLGNAIGSILPPLIVYSTGSSSSCHDIHGMDTLMLVQFLMALAALLLIAVIFKAAPDIAPSFSEANRVLNRATVLKAAAAAATEQHDDERVNRMSRTSRASHGGRLSVDAANFSMKLALDNHNISQIYAELNELFQNREYILLLLSFSIGLGLTNAVLTLVFQLVSPVGYSNADAGWFSFILIIVGMIGAAPMSMILEKSRAYRFIYTNMFIICLISVGFFCSMLYSNNYTLLLFAFGFMGLTIIPLFPACLENTAECTYPVSEDISVGVLLTAGNLGTILITIMLQYTIEKSHYDNLPWNTSNIFTMSVLSVGTVLAVLFQGDSRRLHADNVGAVDQENDNTLTNPLME